MRSEDASLLKGWRAAAVVLSCMGHAWCTRGHVRGLSNTTGTGWPWRYHNPYESLQTTGTWFATPTRRSPANPPSATGFHCQLKIVVSPVRFPGLAIFHCTAQGQVPKVPLMPESGSSASRSGPILAPHPFSNPASSSAGTTRRGGDAVSVAIPSGLVDAGRERATIDHVRVDALEPGGERIEQLGRQALQKHSSHEPVRSRLAPLDSTPTVFGL
jgi:hypothetical protein